MKNGSPDFLVKFSAKDDGTFGATIRKVKADLAEVSKQLAAGVTGGIVGGGSVGAILAVVDRVSRLVGETIRLAEIGRKISVPFQRTRGLSTAATTMGVNQDALFSAIGNLDQRRADALAGDPEAVESFRRIGISLKEIADLKPDELFFRVGDSFRGAQTAQKVISARQLFGSEDLLPFLLKGGGQMFRPGPAEESGTGWALSKVFSPAVRMYESMTGGNKFAASTDPISTYQLERQNAAQKLATQNRERSIDLVRSQLPLEQQMTMALGERLKIERELSTVTDPVKRERLVGRILDLDSTILSARNAQMSAQTAPTGATWTRNLDEMSRAGIFTGGSPSLFIDLAKQQLSEARKQTDLLRTNPAEIAKSL